MDVRPSDITALEDKVKKRNYLKYLSEIKLHHVRAFQDQKVTFDFPVSAIIGTNGGGKSTILGAAALAYKATKPGDYFPKSNVGDNSMSDWRIDYEIIDRNKQPQNSLNRNARFTSQKWRRDELLEREVVVFPIQRTVPAGEQTKYKKYIGIHRKEVIIEVLPEPICVAAGRILGKDLCKFKIARLKEGDADYLLLGMQKSNEYSQFHFGAGEASIITMVSKIEQASEQALILIEEIENGLHPVATEKMIDYLIDVAKRKKQQVIFTTHSEYALKILPPSAIWACLDGEAYQGRLSIDSLRAITGTIEKERVIFVEDRFAEDWVKDILRQFSLSVLETSEVHEAGGYPSIIEVLKHHNKNPTIGKKAKAVVDGDVELKEEEKKEPITCLPGDKPENEVFWFVKNNIEKFAAKIQQRCLCPNISEDQIIKFLKDVVIDTTDCHKYFRKFGEKIGYVSEITVRNAFISIYDEENKERLRDLFNFLTDVNSV